MGSSNLFSDDGGSGSDNDMDSLFGDAPPTTSDEVGAAFDLQDFFGEQPIGSLDGSEMRAMDFCAKLDGLEDDAVAASADGFLPTPSQPLPLPPPSLPWPFPQPPQPPEPLQETLFSFPLPALAQAMPLPLPPLPLSSLPLPVPMPSVDASPQQQQQYQQDQHQDQHYHEQPQTQQQHRQQKSQLFGEGSQQSAYNFDCTLLTTEAETLIEAWVGPNGQQRQGGSENADIETPVLEVRPQEPQTQMHTQAQTKMHTQAQTQMHTQAQTQMHTQAQTQLPQQGQIPAPSGHHLELRPRCPDRPPLARIDLKENRFEELLPYVQLRSLSFKVIFGKLGVDSITGKSILDECRAHLAKPAYAVERTGTVDPGAVRVFKITLILSAIGYLCHGSGEDSGCGAGERWFGHSRSGLRAGAAASGAAEEAAEVEQGGFQWPEGSTNLVLLFVQLFYRISRTEDKHKRQSRQKRAFNEAVGAAPPKPMSMPMPPFPLPARALSGPAFSGMAYNSPVFLREHLSRTCPPECVSPGSSEEPPASIAASSRSASTASSASASTTARSQSVASEDSALLSLLSESPPALFSAASFVSGSGDGERQERPAKRQKSSEAGASYECPLVL